MTAVPDDELPQALREGVGTLARQLGALHSRLTVGFNRPPPREALWRVQAIGRALAMLCDELGVPPPYAGELGLDRWPVSQLGPTIDVGRLAAGDGDGRGDAWEG